MIDLTQSVDQIAAQIKQAALSDQPELLLTVAEHARSGFKSWAASNNRRRGDALNRLLTKSVVSLRKNRDTVPDFDSIVKNLWDVDNTEDPTIIDINGVYKFIVWQDSNDEYQKTSFRLIQKRIDRILKKLGLSTKA